jgi:hypothetical protein
MLALLYNFGCSVELVHFNPIRQRDGVADDLSLEIAAAAARVNPLLPERGFNPAKSRTAWQRAALLFAPVRQSRSDAATFHILHVRCGSSTGFVHSSSKATVLPTILSRRVIHDISLDSRGANRTIHRVMHMNEKGELNLAPPSCAAIRRNDPPTISSS